MNSILRNSPFIIIALLIVAISFGFNMTSPKKITSEIGKGNMDTAVKNFIFLVKKDRINNKEFEKLLDTFFKSRLFTLNHADQIYNDLSGKHREKILKWHSDVYLASAEYLMSNNESIKEFGIKRFEKARNVWKRYIKLRSKDSSKYKLKYTISVLGIIDLREAKAYLEQKNYKKAEKLFIKARKQLTEKKPFDLLTIEGLKNLAKEIDKELKTHKI